MWKHPDRDLESEIVSGKTSPPLGQRRTQEWRQFCAILFMATTLTDEFEY